MKDEEVIQAARGNMGPLCKSCPVCNGKACGNTMPGPGAKGSGLGAIRNYEAWQKLYVNMDTLTENVEAELKEIISLADVPFIVKGIMTVKGAIKARNAGAAAIVVSNHGGRVLDGVPASATVLPEIVEAVGKDMKIFVDGGIRSGTDIFKALALGADAVLIARPFVNRIYGAQEEGVQVYVDRLQSELKDTMEMCGAKDLASITSDMIRKSTD